ALEQDLIADTAAQARSGLERRLDGDVVDARLQDAFEVVVGHRCGLAELRSTGGRLTSRSKCLSGRQRSTGNRQPTTREHYGSRKRARRSADCIGQLQ